MCRVTCLKAEIFADCLLLRCSDVAEMQQLEDWSKMGSQTLGQAQPVIFFIYCLSSAFLYLELYYKLLKLFYKIPFAMSMKKKLIPLQGEK